MAAIDRKNNIEPKSLPNSPVVLPAEPDSDTAEHRASGAATAGSMRWFAVTFPDPLEFNRLRQFVRSLTSRSRHRWPNVSEPMVFEVEAGRGTIHWRLGLSHRETDVILASLRLALPSVRLSAIDPPGRDFTSAWELRLSSRVRPLQSKFPEEAASAVFAVDRHGIP